LGERPKRLAQVAWLIENHRDAVELELIRHGERLRWMGSPRLSWHDVWLICAHPEPKGQLARELDGRAEWSDNEWLLAQIADATSLILWAVAGGKKSQRPKPLPRPGEEKRKRGGLRVMPVDQMRALLARPRVAVKQGRARDERGRFVKAGR